MQPDQRSPEEPPPTGRIVPVRGDWWDGPGRIFLIWGILNPNGPTLYTLGAREFDGKHRPFMRWLHMLGGETVYAADARNEVTYDSLHAAAAQIDRYLADKQEPGLFRVIPSFVIANGGDELVLDIARQLIASGAAGGADWGKELAYLREFGTRFFARAGAEIRGEYEAMLAEGGAVAESAEFIQLRYGHVPDFRDARIPSWTRRSLTPQLLDEWIRIISTREFRLDALSALGEMWDGALDLMASAGSTNLIPWRRVLEFVDRLDFRLAR